MLKQLRSRKLMKRIMIVTIILVIPSFVLFYGWSKKEQTSQLKAASWIQVKKNWWSKWDYIQHPQILFAEDKISGEIFSILAQYGQYVNWRQISQKIPDEDMAEEAFNNFIMLDFAKKNHLTTSRAEAFSYIKSMWPENTKQYVDYYCGMKNISQKQFVRDQQISLTLLKAEKEFLSDTKLSLYEIWQEFLISEEKLSIDYVTFNKRDYLSKIIANDEEIKNYYEENKEDYRLPDQVSYDYIALQKSDLKSSATITTKEIEVYYGENKKDFLEPEKRKLHQIVVPLEKNKEEEIKEKSLQVATEARGTPNFESFSQKFSSEAEKIGETLDIGWISKNALQNKYGGEVASKAFSLLKDEISTPVLGYSAFHILKLEDMQEETTKTLAQAKDQIQQILEKNKIEHLFKKEAKQIGSALSKYTTLKSLSKALDLKIKSTGLIDKESRYIMGIGNVRKYQRDLKNLMKGEVSPVIFTTDIAHAVIQITQKLPSHIQPFESVKNQVEAKVKDKKTLEMADKIARQFLLKAAKVQDIKKLADEREYEFKTTENPITRLDGIPGLQIINFAKKTLRAKEKSFHLSPLGFSKENLTGYVVWHLREKEEPTLEQFKTELPKLQLELFSLKQKAIVKEYIEDQKKHLKIIVADHLKPEEE